jgi:Oxidoreductase molybdopterin binding domain
VGLERLRAGRGTNLLLLALVVLAVGTGALAFGFGGRWVVAAVAAHACVGVAFVVLSPWKGAISARGLGRARPGTGVSLALSFASIVAVASGIAHSVGVWTSGLAMQVHVASAVATVPLVAWHVFRRPVTPRRTDLSRRSLVRTGGLAVASVATTGVLEGVVRLASLRGADRRATGSYEIVALERLPVTQWLDDRVPVVAEDAVLEIAGRDGVTRWSLDDVDAFGDEVVATLDCTGGWYSEQRWSGARLDRLLGDVGEARSIVVASSTGYSRRLPIGDAARLVLATRVGGERLTPGHGAPVRLVPPGRRGFWWVKWVARVEVSETPWWWQSPFPLT